MRPYNFSEVVWNGYHDLINNGLVVLNSYNELQAIADMAKDLGHIVNWNSLTGNLWIVKGAADQI